MVCLRWPLPERRPATPQAARLGRSVGSCQRRSLRRVSCRRYPGEHRRPYSLHYFRLARYLPTIGPLRGCECKRLITTVRNPRSTEALEVVSSQQLGHASPWLALDRECPDPLLPRHLSRNLFAVQGMSLFSGLIRSTDMIGHSFMTWETSVGVESEVAQLRRGDLNALSALLMRYQNRLYRYLLRNLQEQAFP